MTALSLIGQTDLEKDRYCVTQKKIYDFNTGKKLKNKEALLLLKDYPKAYKHYNKSVKQKNIAIASGIVFIGFTSYIAGSEDIKNEDFGDLNSTQKIIGIGFMSSAAVFATSLILSEMNRTKSLVEFEKIINKQSEVNQYSKEKDYSLVKLKFDPSGLYLSYSF